ncbi:hypothetical protein BZA70DRAFT_85110 [Myxozyma melibiosi]|uniref:Secreted protein n=1 Tax=Myxozyma melibiosi TaxID=54550 RepID=A0ABR1F093_9ASCO
MRPFLLFNEHASLALITTACFLPLWCLRAPPSRTSAACCRPLSAVLHRSLMIAGPDFIQSSCLFVNKPPPPSTPPSRSSLSRAPAQLCSFVPLSHTKLASKLPGHNGGTPYRTLNPQTLVPPEPLF